MILVLFAATSAFSQSRGVIGDPSSQARARNQTTNTSGSVIIVPTIPLSAPATEIIVPLSVEGRSFSTVKLVSCAIFGSGSSQNYLIEKRYAFDSVEDAMVFTSLSIENPHTIDKKRARKDPTFLKTVKDDQSLYLYVIQSRSAGADKNTLVMLKDAQNSTIYKASHTNTSLTDCLSVMSEF